MPEGIKPDAWERKKQDACDDFYSDIEIASVFLAHFCEEHGIPKKVYEKAWDKYAEELDQHIYNNFIFDLDPDEMGGGK